ncbi:hypothetical protein Bbelb_150020 [Branchiostoma belcheri]|nr:hypothetical protein Bbelb_150020 [Branchiostoma belcheri]
MLFLLLLAAACADSNAHCRKAEWRTCVPFTGKPGFDSITGVCVVCEALHEDSASRSPFSFLAGVKEVAIRGYPFHVMSAKKLAPIDSSGVNTLALIDAEIVDVKNYTFSDLPKLERLSLDSNRLTNVKRAWFMGLETLSVLVLSNNSIKHIEPGSFMGLTHLLILDLENNLLQAVDHAWLSGLQSINTLNLKSNAINSLSPGSLQSLQLMTLDMRDNDLSCLDKDVLWGQSWLSRFHASSGMLSSVHDAMPHGMIWRLDRLQHVIRRSVTIVVEVPKFHFCVRQDANELSFGWMFNSSENAIGDIDFSVVNINPGRSCGDLESFLSAISIQAPAVVLATDGSLADKLTTNTPEQCRQVWEYDGGITVPLVGDSIFRLVSMATGNTTSEGVAMSFVKKQDSSTLTTTELVSSQKHTTNTNNTHDNTRNITCILLSRRQITKLYFTVLLVKSQTHTTETTSYKLVTNPSSSPTHYLETIEKYYTSAKPRYQSTLQMSSTTGQDHVRISILVSAVVVLVMSFLAVLLWNVYAATRLSAEDDRASDDTHVWTIPPGVAFPGLLRSASLPTYSDKMASDDAASCRSLPAVLHSIEPTYSEIPDDVACAQGELHGLQHVPVPTHTYSEIPDDEATGPVPFCSDADFPLHVVTNRRQNRRLLGGNRITSSRQRSGRSIATYGSTGHANDQRNPYYRNASLVQGIRARRQMRADLVFRPDQDVRTYVNVIDGIMSRRAHIAFLILPNTYWPQEIPGEGTHNTVRRASLPTVTLPNTYWPWEIPGEGSNFIRRPVSLPTVTLPNTYWPWEIPGEGTCGPARRASHPTVTLPNTYWPWEIPGEGTCNTARRASLPTVTLPNTYWPWEILGEGTCGPARRASHPTVTLPNTYWPWEIPGEGACNTPRRASLPNVTLPNTYWPWEIPGEGACNAARRVSLPNVTLPNTYWPWEIPGEGACNTARRVSLPTVTLPNTYWPWEIPGEGACNTPRRASLPNVTLPNTYWPWEIPGEGVCNAARRVSLPTVTLPNTYWPWEIPGEGTCNTPRRASLPTVTLPNTYWPWEIPGEGTRNTARRASLLTVTLPNTYWPWEIPGEGPCKTPRRASLSTLPNT